MITLGSRHGCGVTNQGREDIGEGAAELVHGDSGVVEGFVGVFQLLTGQQLIGGGLGVLLGGDSKSQTLEQVSVGADGGEQGMIEVDDDG